MTEMNRERREELYEAAKNPDYLAFPHWDNLPVDAQWDEGALVTHGELRTLLHDSARLERIERQVRELADYLQVARDEGMIQRDDPWKPDSVIKQLRAIVDTGRGED